LPTRNTKKTSILYSAQQSDEEYDEYEENYDEDENDEEGYEIVISTTQIKMLRKEIGKRSNTKRLPVVFVPNEQTDGEFTMETLEDMEKVFSDNELVQVRGLSKSNLKAVKQVVDILSIQMEDLLQRMVIPVQVKGFSAIFYSPFDDDSRPDRIQLRTSYQPNQWRPKPKPVRDERGQILKGPDGKSLKE